MLFRPDQSVNDINYADSNAVYSPAKTVASLTNIPVAQVVEPEEE